MLVIVIRPPTDSRTTGQSAGVTKNNAATPAESSATWPHQGKLARAETGHHWDQGKSRDTEALRTIAELAERRDQVEAELTEAVRSTRQAHRSWSEIGTESYSQAPPSSTRARSGAVAWKSGIITGTSLKSHVLSPRRSRQAGVTPCTKAQSARLREPTGKLSGKASHHCLGSLAPGGSAGRHHGNELQSGDLRVRARAAPSQVIRQSVGALFLPTYLLGNLKEKESAGCHVWQLDFYPDPCNP